MKLHLIIRLESEGTDRARGEVVLQRSVRVASTGRGSTPMDWRKAAELLASEGYELGSQLQHAPKSEWPFTVCVYRSPNPDGMGRSGSSLDRFPARRKTPG